MHRKHRLFGTTVQTPLTISPKQTSSVRVLQTFKLTSTLYTLTSLSRNQSTATSQLKLRKLTRVCFDKKLDVWGMKSSSSQLLLTIQHYISSRVLEQELRRAIWHDAVLSRATSEARPCVQLRSHCPQRLVAPGSTNQGHAKRQRRRRVAALGQQPCTLSHHTCTCKAACA